jgi:hypothetical protein
VPEIGGKEQILEENERNKKGRETKEETNQE